MSQACSTCHFYYSRVIHTFLPLSPQRCIEPILLRSVTTRLSHLEHPPITLCNGNTQPPKAPKQALLHTPAALVSLDALGFCRCHRPARPQPHAKTRHHARCHGPKDRCGLSHHGAGSECSVVHVALHWAAAGSKESIDPRMLYTSRRMCPSRRAESANTYMYTYVHACVHHLSTVPAIDKHFLPPFTSASASTRQAELVAARYDCDGQIIQSIDTSTRQAFAGGASLNHLVPCRGCSRVTSTYMY